MNDPADDPRYDIEAKIQAGELADALGLTLALLGGEPDPGTQLLASILQCQQLEFDAALGMLEALATANPGWRTLAQELAYCVVADQVRTARLDDPEVAMDRAGIAPPPEFAQHQLEAAVYHARGEFDEARKMLDAARAATPPLPGQIVRTTGQIVPFADLTDSDQLVGPMLQAIGPRGLLDIPFSELRTVQLVVPRAYHDVLWQVARIETWSGNAVTVRVPVLYPGSSQSDFAPVRSGSLTTWDKSAGYRIATGQRELVATAEDGKSRSVGLRQIAHIQFTPAAAH